MARELRTPPAVPNFPVEHFDDFSRGEQELLRPLYNMMHWMLRPGVVAPLEGPRWEAAHRRVSGLILPFSTDDPSIVRFTRYSPTDMRINEPLAVEVGNPDAPNVTIVDATSHAAEQNGVGSAADLISATRKQMQIDPKYAEENRLVVVFSNPQDALANRTWFPGLSQIGEWKDHVVRRLQPGIESAHSLPFTHGAYSYAPDNPSPGVQLLIDTIEDVVMHSPVKRVVTVGLHDMVINTGPKPASTELGADDDPHDVALNRVSAGAGRPIGEIPPDIPQRPHVTRHGTYTGVYEDWRAQLIIDRMSGYMLGGNLGDYAETLARERTAAGKGHVEIRSTTLESTAFQPVRTAIVESPLPDDDLDRLRALVRKTQQYAIDLIGRADEHIDTVATANGKLVSPLFGAGAYGDKDLPIAIIGNETHEDLGRLRFLQHASTCALLLRSMSPAIRMLRRHPDLARGFLGELERESELASRSIDRFFAPTPQRVSTFDQAALLLVSTSRTAQHEVSPDAWWQLGAYFAETLERDTLRTANAHSAHLKEVTLPNRGPEGTPVPHHGLGRTNLLFHERP